MDERYLDDPDVGRMLRVRDGDMAAYAELVERHAPAVIAFSRRFLDSVEAAEDLAQEVFLKVHRAAGTYEPRARFKTWMLTIATNLCLNERRRKKRHFHLSLDAGHEGEGEGSYAAMVAGDGPMPDERLDRSELQERVRAAVAALPESQRAVILLARFEQLSYAEIAVALQTSVMAVKSLLNRAKTNLKEALGRDLKEYLVLRADER